MSLDWFNAEMLDALLLLAGACVASFVVYFILTTILKDWIKKFLPKAPNFKKLFRPIRLLVIVVGLLLVLPWISMPAAYEHYITKILQILLIFSLGWLVLRFGDLCRNIFFRRYDMEKSDNLRARQVLTQLKLFHTIFNVVVIVLTIAFMLMTFGKVRQIGVSLLASAGVLSVVFGFAAQKTLGNLIAGIQLAFTQPIRLDDVVIIEGEWGWVEEITLTYVVVRIWDKRRLVVPLTYFMDKPFQNWTRTSADLLGTVYVYVDYTVPVDKVREELTRILDGHEKWDKKVNVLQVTNTSEKTMELRALMSAKDSPTAWELRCDVREKLITFLQKQYPQSLPKVRLDISESSSFQKDT